jgi:glutathione synthase/RimK-type ligase-like ATP-grasp enzyme
MKLILLTDLPVWVRPLAEALVGAGVEVQVATTPEEVPAEGCVVNRISALLVARQPQRSEQLSQALADWEGRGRRVVNGARCHRIGQSKRLQAQLFHDSGAATPRTLAAVPGGRAMPEERVLLKPPAGGFGKGIVALEPGEAAPRDLFESGSGWVEQQRVQPADGWVHRVELLGSRILYAARSPHQVGNFNYCLTHAGAEVELKSESDLPPRVIEAVGQVARRGGLELGAVEYFMGQDGAPVFFDFNPVSGLHPQAGAFLGEDPWQRVARFLIDEALQAEALQGS